MTGLVVLVCTEAPPRSGLGHLADAQDLEVRWLVARPGRLRDHVRWHERRTPPRGVPALPVDRDRVRPVVERAIADLPPGTVLVPIDRPATIALHALRHSLADLLVVDTPEHALRAARLIAAGRSVPSLIAPPPVDATLSERATTTLVTDGADRATWLGVGASELTVDVRPLTPLARAVVKERSHVVVQHPGGERGRLLVAPANYAGQGWAWARAVRHHVPGWDARTVTVTSPRARFHFESDVTISADRWRDPIARHTLAIGDVLPSTHVLLEAMRPILGARDIGANGWDVPAAVHDVRALVESGRPTALLFHGSEVRRPGVHSAGLGWTPFTAAATDRWTSHLTTVTAAVHAAAAELDVPRFVSTLDLLDDVPDATWLPISLLPGDFAPTEPPLQGSRPVVLHLPSASRLKGTLDIEAVLEGLDQRGDILYRRPGTVPPALVPHLLREADIVIDQVVLGNPTVLAAQALAAGRVVIAHLPDHVRRRFPVAPPVIEATPLTLRSAMLDVLADREAAREIAARGPVFARELHDGRLSAAVLRDTFLDPTGGAA